ncbi:hypothetical protein VPH35_133540 [Triticum aestivum]
MRSFQPIITPTILIGNSLYWLRLTLIEPPQDAYAHDDTVFAVMPAEDDGLGLIIVSGFRAQLWKWKARVRHDGATWVLGKTVELDKLLPLGAAGKRKPLALSMTFKRLCNSGSARDIHIYNAFPSFYDAGYQMNYNNFI